MRSRAGRAWWLVFSILIAGPALALALLGLRAIRSDRIEREQSLRDQQSRIARLADAAIQNAVRSIATRLDQLDMASLIKRSPTPPEEEFPVFVLDRSDVLSFPRERIYFAAVNVHP